MSRLSRLRETFWFLPALLCVGGAVLAELLVTFDANVDWSAGPLDALLYRVGEDGSRDVLGVIAGSSMAVASTSFSITIAVLALTSSSYGPRLVRNFMTDRGNQLVLGVYVATFLYCLLVLRSIRVRGSGGSPFVPHLAVNVAVLFAVGNVGVLVYFIHHISDSIQVWTLSSRVRGELRSLVERLYPAEVGEEPAAGAPGSHDVEADEVLARADSDGFAVTSERPGYVVAIDADGVLSAAVQADAVIRLEVRPGSYVIDGEPTARVWPPTAGGDEVVAAVRSALTIGNSRTPRQDVEFAAMQLVEMAVRALSPGTNDPWTAINALDELSSGLADLARRAEPSRVRVDAAGRVRVVAPLHHAAEILDLVADSMRHYAMGAPSVVFRTLELLGRVGVVARDDRLRARALHHVDLLVEAFRRAGPQDVDLAALDAQAGDVRSRIARAGLAGTPMGPLP